MSVAEENKALVRRFIEEVYNRGNLDVVANELLAPNFIDHGAPPGKDAGIEGYKRGVASFRSAIPDLHLTVEYQVAEGDKVVTRYRGRGTLQEEHRGIVPTGKEVPTTGITIHRIAGDKIAEEWSEGSGLLGVAQQRLEQEERERERVEQELKVAREIQLGSLPKRVPSLEDWQISPYYQSAKEVGGDFYEFYQLDDGRVGLAVGDGTGKGVPAAILMIGTVAYLGGVAAASGAPPSEALALANEAFFVRIPANMFVTCFYAILDPKSGILSYANAGHDLPYLHHSGECEELRARGMPLGMMPGMSYEEGNVSLTEGDCVLFYSDGLVEAHNPHGEMFGFPRLRALVAEHGG